MEREQADRLLDDCVFEVIPMASTLAKSDALPPNATVSVTASPTSGMGPTVDLAVELGHRGFRPVPHLSARATTTKAELERIVGRLADAGIDEVFVVGGDGADPGDFFDARALLESLDAIGHPFRRIGVAGYPEGHPTIPGEQLMAALADKSAYASYVTTQMCFDPAAIHDWVRSIRAVDIELPVRLGVAGAVEPAKLLAIGARIGVGQSLRYLRKNRKAVAAIMRGGTSASDRIIDALAPVAPELGIEGLHVFTFNALAETTAWWRDRRAPT